jgi:hypothetical protein
MANSLENGNKLLSFIRSVECVEDQKNFHLFFKGPSGLTAAV